MDELLSTMTLEEKAAQLGSVPIGLLLDAGRFSQTRAAELLSGGVGQITRLAGGANITPSQAAEAGNGAQEYLVRHTRLRIPAMVHEECLAGLLAKGATIFPVPIAMASSWNPPLISTVTGEIARSVRAVGGHQGLCPVLDVVRDPRWGRVEETFGEDHHLVARMGVAYVLGLQGPPDLSGLSRGIAATAKHFAAHGFSEGGRNCAPVHLGPRELREVFLHPFECAVKEAGLQSVMSAYHDIDGVPCSSSRALLTDILRSEWGFSGIVVSDYFAIPRLRDVHGTAADYRDAASQALRAGLDVELPQTQCYGATLVQAVRDGLVAEKTLDESVRRMLQMKTRVGVFERHTVNARAADRGVNTPAQRALSRQVALQSMVLLTNRGSLLPLRRDIRSIAVVGPSAASRRNLLGDYSFATHVSWNEHDIEIVTVLEGIGDRVSRGTVVRHARGCDTSSPSRDGFAEAVEAARRSGVCIFVGGDLSGLSSSADTTGEMRDRAELGLPGVQEDLLRELVATGTPVVVVLVNGRVFTLSWLAEHADAILEAWLPGEEGGNAVADVLFGLANPGGKLPVTFPRETGQIPIPYNRTQASVVPYVFTPPSGLFPFGHGLSYASFSYSGLRVSRRIRPDDDLEVGFLLRNDGPRPGDEVVQVYVRDEVASIARPLKELKAFRRVSLRAGQRTRIDLSIPARELGFVNQDMQRVVEPGTFSLGVGSSSEDIRLRGGFEVSG